MLQVGLQGERRRTVTEADTAARHGSGLAPVFSTPALVALMEGAAVAALEGQLPAGQTSLGVRIDVRHLAATPVGMEVRARAVLEEVDGRRLVFRVEAWDAVEKIGEARHERFLVDEARFLQKVAAKAGEG